MTQFNDVLNVGQAGAAGIDSRAPLEAGAGPVYYQAGASTSPLFVYDIVPLTLDKSNIAASQVVSGASFTLTAGTGVTSTTIKGTAYLALDVPRCITASGVSTTTAEVAISVTGLDAYLQPQTMTFSGPSGTATPTIGTKAFKYISAISTVGNTLSGITIGTSDTLGLPRRVDAFGYITINWADVLKTAATGFTAAVTTTPSATTGDVRGTYALQTSAADGTRRLVVTTFCKNPDTIDGLYGKTPA